MKELIESLKQQAVDFEKFTHKYWFTSNNRPLSAEHLDQIFILEGQASQVLWDLELSYGYVCDKRYFHSFRTFEQDYREPKKTKKFLYQLGIPFQQEVYMVVQPYLAFILSWKMAIHYSDTLFCFYEQTVWDSSLNWKLEYRKDVFTFGKGLLHRR